MEESILKAIALDAFEPGQKCSSSVDDVFFIVRKSIRLVLTPQLQNLSRNIFHGQDIVKFLKIGDPLKLNLLMVYVPS